MDALSTIRKIVPEIAELLERRHTVLQNVYFMQPVGRRALAARLKWPERMVRKEIEFLKDAGLLVSTAGGMEVGEHGEEVLFSLKEIIRNLHGLSDMEKALAARLGLKHVLIVPGDSDEDEAVKKEIARATARFLAETLRDGDVLAVTGGTTLAEVARSFPFSGQERDLTVVPARGGLGEEVELQANTVAASLAQRLGGRHRLLHVPDDLGEEARSTIASEPKIRELIELIRSARVLLHGVGPADDMARRRAMPEEDMQMLKERKAVGEAFGYYFDREGRIVYTTSSVGMRFEDLKDVELVVVVGGGHSKAEAALAVLSSQLQDVYITDEGAAKGMLRRLGVQV